MESRGREVRLVGGRVAHPTLVWETGVSCPRSEAKGVFVFWGGFLSELFSRQLFESLWKEQPLLSLR